MDDNHHSNILGENDNYYEDSEGSSYEHTEDEEEENNQDEMEREEHTLQIEATRQPFEMTPNHSKILILISKYGKTATAEDPEESWIRQLPLTVMIYEGITAGAIDCDYAPKSLIISSDGMCVRKFTNISQDAHTMLETLVEEKLVIGLKLSTTEFRPITAYQVSEKGMQFLNSLPASLFDTVNSFVYAPHAPMVDTELLHVVFTGEGFMVKTESGYSRESTCTDIEDVSYVVSPFLPGTLLSPGATTRSNAHRAHEASIGITNVRDKKFKEAITLDEVHVLVGEWVPFGANGVVQLNDKLGSLNRCQGGLFSSMVDKTPMEMCFRMKPGLTSVRVIDFSYVHKVSMEVECVLPEESGIVQIEVFGLHINMDGTVYQGAKIEAIMNRKANDVSIDFLARVLVDVQLDSSKVLHDIISGYHRSLLDVMYMKDAANRAKFNLILAQKIHPKKDKARAYADRGQFENELKQVLGSILVAEDLSAEDILILGKEGLLLAGPNILTFEPYILHYASLQCREIFVTNLFLRTFVLKEGVEKIHQIILQHYTDPSNLSRIQAALSEASSDIFQLYEILEYLEESIKDTVKPPDPQDEMCKKLVSTLSTPSLEQNIISRVDDMRKLLQGASNILKNLMDDTDVITTAQLEDVFNNIDANVKFLVDSSAAGARASASLGVMQIVLAGSFCFAILDRVAGGSFSFTAPNWAYDLIYQPVMMVPGLWFAFNLGWLLVCSYGLIRLMKYLELVADGTLILRVKINKKIKSKDGLQAFFSDKAVDVTDVELWVDNPTTKVVEWAEEDDDKWLGSAPTIEFTFDATNNFVLSAAFGVDKKTSNATENDLVNILLQDLVMADAMDREVAFGADALDEDLLRGQEAEARTEEKPARSLGNLFGLL